MEPKQETSPNASSHRLYCPKTPIDIPYFQRKLRRDKNFLRRVYTSGTLEVERILRGATNAELITLIAVLYLIVQKAIPLGAKTKEKLTGHRQFQHLLHFFNSNKRYSGLCNSDSSKKIKQLLTYANMYKLLLKPLFN